MSNDEAVGIWRLRISELKLYKKFLSLPFSSQDSTLVTDVSLSLSPSSPPPPTVILHLWEMTGRDRAILVRPSVTWLKIQKGICVKLRSRTVAYFLLIRLNTFRSGGVVLENLMIPSERPLWFCHFFIMILHENMTPDPEICSLCRFPPSKFLPKLGFQGT